MPPYDIPITLFVFAAAVLLLVWRPKELNEAVPTSIGAVILIVCGIVPIADLSAILGIVSGAALTILSTIAMSIVMDNIGVFQWAARNVLRYANGSGLRLYWYVIALCFLMTMFFNNDGSVLITTPIIVRMVSMLKLKPHQKIAYLLSGALVATASSAPIGVSNLANLIALHIVGLDLSTYALYMFVPSLIGIAVVASLTFLYFHRDLPRKIHQPERYYAAAIAISGDYGYTYGEEGTAGERTMRHPLQAMPKKESEYDFVLFRIAVGLVVLTRALFFLGSSLHVPIQWIGITGAALLVILRWIRLKRGPKDLIVKTPWHILLFAFSVYVIVFALQHIGLTDTLVQFLKGRIADNRLAAVFWMGGTLTILSNLMNNLPSVMIGTLSLTQMGLPVSLMQLAYLANIIGSDIGSLILPMGTLASLVWMFILRKNKIPISWPQYLKVTILVIPAGLFASLISLYYWTRLFLP